MFSMEFRYKFEAAHRFTKSCSFSCATPHGHTWYSVAIVKAYSDTIGEDDMVVEFARVKKYWKILLDEVFDHSWLGNIEDPILPSLREHIPHLRLMPFPSDPTTEVIAGLLFYKMQKFIEEAKLEKILYVESVRIEETPTNSVVWNGPALPKALFADNGSVFGYKGWWMNADPKSREIVKVTNVGRQRRQSGCKL